MKLGTRARTVLLVLVWHTFVQPLGRVRRASKGILHTKFYHYQNEIKLKSCQIGIIVVVKLVLL